MNSPLCNEYILIKNLKNYLEDTILAYSKDFFNDNAKFW
jgi:hypothetical protein